MCSSASHILAELQLIVDSAFTEMEAALLQSRHDCARSTRDAPQDIVMRNEEEQEWLDEQMAEVDEAAAGEDEDSFVRRMMGAHSLDEDEARWLFRRQGSVTRPQESG
jgi:hypothetical protein